MVSPTSVDFSCFRLYAYHRLKPADLDDNLDLLKKTIKYLLLLPAPVPRVTCMYFLQNIRQMPHHRQMLSLGFIFRGC